MFGASSSDWARAGAPTNSAAHAATLLVTMSLPLRAPGAEPVRETHKVVDVDRGRIGGPIAVGVGVRGGEAGQEALEVRDVQGGRRDAAVAVWVAEDGESGGTAQGGGARA